MKKGKRVIAVLLYILAVALLLGLRPKELFDLRQFLLVIAGGMILYLPTMEKEDFRQWKMPDFGLLARNTIYASYIETFILLFLLLYQGPEAEQIRLLAAVQEEGKEASLVSAILMRNIALSFRPLLYGICIWIALGSEEGKAGSKKNGQAGEPAEKTVREEKRWTAQECYERFLELGLIRREAEVAVQICKGVSNKEIAMELCISETTVKKHVSNIFEKLGVKKREEIRKLL